MPSKRILSHVFKTVSTNLLDNSLNDDFQGFSILRSFRFFDSPKILRFSACDSCCLLLPRRYWHCVGAKAGMFLLYFRCCRMHIDKICMIHLNNISVALLWCLGLLLCLMLRPLKTGFVIFLSYNEQQRCAVQSLKFMTNINEVCVCVCGHVSTLWCDCICTFFFPPSFNDFSLCSKQTLHKTFENNRQSVLLQMIPSCSQ